MLEAGVFAMMAANGIRFRLWGLAIVLGARVS
jgi:hypothetical protein